VFHQPGVGGGANAPQQDQVMVILIRDNLEVIPRRYSPARPDSLRYYKLATLADVGRHEV
jgi:hypothetical protein